MVTRLGTTNGGGTTSPADAKIIVGGPRTRHGWGGNAAALTLMPVLIPVFPRAAVRRSAAGRFLEGSLGGLILAVTHSSLRSLLAMLRSLNTLLSSIDASPRDND